MNYNPAPKPRINLNRSLGWNLDNRKDMEITERIYDGADCYRWRPYYAWLPVKTITGKHVWGKKIYKQRYWAVWGNGFHMEPHVEYAELFDILDDA
jgi:hypothetical protein